MSDFVRVDLLDLYLVNETETLGDGTLAGAVSTLTSLLHRVPIDHHGSVQFAIEQEGGDYGGPGHATVKVWYERPKTTAELEAERAERENSAKASAARQEQQERAVLAALKAKYGE